ncbi:hypothetical protein D3C80_1610690 [compost metagenome]
MRGDQVVAHLEFRQAELLLERLDHLQLQVVGVADRLARVGAQVGEGNRGVAVAEGDAAGFLDLLQGTGQFFGYDGSGDQGGNDGGTQHSGSETHEIYLDWFLFVVQSCTGRVSPLSGACSR